MMGWIVMVLLAALVTAALWRFAGFRGATLQLLLAAMLIAMAGYAWQGMPALGSQSKAQAMRQDNPETAFAALRGEFLERFDYASRWMIIADSYQRRGDTESAVAIIKAGLKASPNNSTLWTALGNALVLHGGGTMNPAAEIAYRRAMALAPGYPAPRFFYGLSLIQTGQIEEGERIWRQILATAPAGASWQPVIAERLAIIDQLGAMQQAQPSPLR